MTESTETTETTIPPRGPIRTAIPKATNPVFGQVKITGPAAVRLKTEAAARRLSLNALCSEYVLLGLEKPGPDDDALAGVERRIVSTLLGVRGEVDTLGASVDVLAALVDTLSKILLVHLPEPARDDIDGINASALSRYEKLLQQTAEHGFDGNRPRAIQRIAELLLRSHPRPDLDEGSE